MLFFIWTQTRFLDPDLNLNPDPNDRNGSGLAKSYEFVNFFFEHVGVHYIEYRYRTAQYLSWDVSFEASTSLRILT